MMLWINARIKSVRDDGERGIAMVLVVGITSLLAILLVAAVSLTLGNIKSAQYSSDWNSALAAAYAGVEEYQSRLANDPAYYQYGNPDSKFSIPADGTKKSNVRLPTGTEVNDAFGVGAAQKWAIVKGSDGVSTYRYEVNNSTYETDGRIRVRSTGRVGNETRTIVADLKQQGFIDFLYFTDLEIQDPILSGDDVATCDVYAWAGRSSTCNDIAFGASDVLNGPVHSNDIIRACKAEFNGPVTTTWNPTTGARYKNIDSNGNACTVPTFAQVGDPAFNNKVGMPASNSEIRKETRTDLPNEVPKPGCLYTGPTTIKFLNNGTMTVRSPWTQFTRVEGDGSTSGSNDTAGMSRDKCGTPGTSGLGSTTGQTIPVPDSNVIFVQSVPSISTNKNYRSSLNFPSSYTCTGADSKTVGNGLGYPRSDELVPSGTPYGCRNGDVFVEGKVKGNVTIAAENYIYATGDLVYNDPEKDLLGLVGNNAIFVYNPVRASNGKAMLTDTSREIDAAMLSVAHTFQTQNHDKGGDRGELTIKGAIGQKYRGPVRSTSNGGATINGGYSKNYNYDPRLKYTSPPKFLSPVTVTYGVNIWVEVSPVFDSKGAIR